MLIFMKSSIRDLDFHQKSSIVEEMKRIQRRLDLGDALKRKSCFLFGPRQVGKTFLIRETLPQYRCYNLLRTDLYRELSANPERLRQEVQPNDEIIIIDEIQKLPVLLDEVQLLIEERGIRFLLTGSSARKLHAKGTNLLGGRARSRRLHPLSGVELQVQFDLKRALSRGLLPSIYFSDEPHEDLQAYVGDYLKEEVAGEALVRNVPAFSRFLAIAGQCHGTMVNYAAVASDAQMPAATVRSYFEILEDTLIGWRLPAWRKTIKRKATATDKFYLFDNGVAHQLQGRRNLAPRSPEFGEAFESWVGHELRCYTDYVEPLDLCYWRSLSNFEVDFILGDRVAIEVKAKQNVGNRDLRGIRALQEENLLERYCVVCLEERQRSVDGVDILPYRQFLEQLWSGKLLE